MDQASGWTDKTKRRLVAKKRISAGLDMGGLGIPHPDETIQGFQQNLLQKIYRKNRTDPTANPSSILLGLLDRANRCNLEDHVHRLGPVQWRRTGDKLSRWNKQLGLAFHAVADLLAAYEMTGNHGILQP